jgi:membrane protease YdiL (CAAX protease family)
LGRKNRKGAALGRTLEDAFAQVERRMDRKAQGEPIETDEHEPVAPRRKTPPATSAPRTKDGYLEVSRSHSAGFIAALPLLAIYELGLVGSDVNAVAHYAKQPIAWLKRHPTDLIGANPIHIINGILVIVAVIAMIRLARRGGLRIGVFGGMIAESSVYALLLGPVILFALHGVLVNTGFQPNLGDWQHKVVASCGAGLYEELFFRAVLLGSIFVVMKDGFGIRPFAAGAFALLVSGAIFSGAHFLPGGDPPNAAAFAYRLMAGVVLGIIFLNRGFGVAAWTHALYDVYVMCFTKVG